MSPDDLEAAFEALSEEGKKALLLLLANSAHARRAAMTLIEEIRRNDPGDYPESGLWAGLLGSNGYVRRPDGSYPTARNARLRNVARHEALLRVYCYAHRRPTLVLVVLTDGRIRPTGDSDRLHWHLADVGTSWATVCRCGAWLGKILTLVPLAVSDDCRAVDVRLVATPVHHISASL